MSFKFERIFDDSIFEAMTTRATEMTAVVTALFLGYLDRATQFAESVGGGGGPGSGWGRKKDEDDLSFGRRCFLLAKNMLQPSEEEDLQQTIRNRTGIKR